MRDTTRNARRIQRKKKARAAAVAARTAFPQNLPAQSASRVPPADKARAVELLERFDTHAGLRNALRHISGTRDEWAGIPMPLTGEHRLIVEPKYPLARELMAMHAPPHERDQTPEEIQRAAADTEYENAKIINKWYSAARGGDIIIFDNNGKRDWGLSAGVHHLSQDLMTLGAMEAWGIEQEHNAVQLLGQHVRHRQLKQYLLTGMFLESSKRSHVMYMFRRLKPTVALSMRGKQPKILATLCLHPIAYYAGSWAGAMCPTDDVVAHLMLMRGDEHMFWKRANQHPPYRPEAGL